MSTKANFRALREEVGLSIPDLADLLKVHPNSIRRWENIDFEQMPPQDAWDILNDLMQKRAWVLDKMLTDKFIEVSRDKHVTLTYFRDQPEYDKFGRDEGNFKLANANARAMARELRANGCDNIEFCYLQEEGNHYQRLVQQGNTPPIETTVAELEAESNYTLEDILEEVVHDDYRDNLLDFDNNIQEFMDVNHITTWDYERVHDAYYSIANNFDTGIYTLEEQYQFDDVSLEEALKLWIPSCYCQDYTNDEHNIFDFLEESNLKLSERPKVAEAYYKILHSFTANADDVNNKDNENTNDDND